MSMRNEMEQLVREEVARVRTEAGTGYTGCWCPLCEIDIVALALTLLPPLYCREENQGHAASIIRAGKIADAVNAALKRVSLWPKHRPGTRPPVKDEVALVNYTLEIGNAVVGPALGQSATHCGCENCRSDALAYALNRYPAKYGVVRGGRRSLHPTYLDFMRYELGMLITQAARVVGAHPNHAA
jgi:hypothetical protein